MHNPRLAIPAALLALALALAGLLALPMRLGAAGTSIYLSLIMAGDPSCVSPPVPTGGPGATAMAKNPQLCTSTPTNTATPTNTPTPTSTATNTPTNTATPTETATPTNTPTPTSTATSTPTTVPPANITVYNTGAFFVQYYVSYNLPGVPLQSLYSGVFNINQGVTLTIPGRATNVGVLIQVYTGITGWQTACTRSYAQATSAVIIVSGTTFLPTCTGG